MRRKWWNGPSKRKINGRAMLRRRHPLRHVRSSTTRPNLNPQSWRPGRWSTPAPARRRTSAPSSRPREASSPAPERARPTRQRSWRKNDSRLRPLKPRAGLRRNANGRRRRSVSARRRWRRRNACAWRSRGRGMKRRGGKRQIRRVRPPEAEVACRRWVVEATSRPHVAAEATQWEMGEQGAARAGETLVVAHPPIVAAGMAAAGTKAAIGMEVAVAVAGSTAAMEEEEEEVAGMTAGVMVEAAAETIAALLARIAVGPNIMHHWYTRVTAQIIK
mmetsp:Transcript_16535/g.39584  ORF Transcript_16535/g.39584 Transcript_16535/m.39584 type:complete len:275 (+) Transcript_16535:635-1459(+)